MNRPDTDAAFDFIIVVVCDKLLVDKGEI